MTRLVVCCCLILFADTPIVKEPSRELPPASNKQVDASAPKTAAGAQVPVIEAQNSSNAVTLRTYKVQNIELDEFARWLAALFPVERISLAKDANTRSVNVIANQSTQIVVAWVLERLERRYDKTSPEKNNTLPKEVVSHRLRNGNLKDVHSAISKVLFYTQAFADENTNSIVVNGSAQAQEQIKKLIDALNNASPRNLSVQSGSNRPRSDRLPAGWPSGPSVNAPAGSPLGLSVDQSGRQQVSRVLPLARSMGLLGSVGGDGRPTPPPNLTADVAALRSASEQLERQARDLANRLRSAESAGNSKPAVQAADDNALREAVGRAYDARMKVYESEVRQLRNRVQRLEAALKQQTDARETAVRRLVDELLARSTTQLAPASNPFAQQPTPTMPPTAIPAPAENVVPPANPPGNPLSPASPAAPPIALPVPSENRIPPSIIPSNQLPPTQPANPPTPVPAGDAILPSANSNDPFVSENAVTPSPRSAPPLDPIQPKDATLPPPALNGSSPNFKIVPTPHEVPGPFSAGKGNVTLLKSADEFIKNTTESRKQLDDLRDRLIDLEKWASAHHLKKAEGAILDAYKAEASRFHRYLREYQAQMQIFDIAKKEAVDALNLYKSRAEVARKQAVAGTISSSELRTAIFAESQAARELERIETIRGLYAGIIEHFGAKPESRPITWQWQPRKAGDDRDVFWKRFHFAATILSRDELPADLLAKQPEVFTGGLLVRAVESFDPQFVVFAVNKDDIILAVDKTQIQNWADFVRVFDSAKGKPFVEATVWDGANLSQRVFAVSGTIRTIGQFASHQGFIDRRSQFAFSSNPVRTIQQDERVAIGSDVLIFARSVTRHGNSTSLMTTAKLESRKGSIGFLETSGLFDRRVDQGSIVAVIVPESITSTNSRIANTAVPAAKVADSSTTNSPIAKRP